MAAEQVLPYDGSMKNVSLRLSDELGRVLDELAATRGTSMNALIGDLIADAAGKPALATSAAPRDVPGGLAMDACMFGPEAIGAIKGVAKQLFERDLVATGAVVYAAAARLIASDPDPERGGPDRASAELTETAQRVVDAHHLELGIRLAEVAIQPGLNPKNRRARNLLGQWMVRSAQRDGDIEKYRRSADLLVDVMEYDDRARLFYGLASLAVAESESDRTARTSALDQIDKAMRRWAFGNRNDSERRSWLSQLRRLSEYGASEVQMGLIEFANENSGWAEIRPIELTDRTTEK